MLLLQKDMEKLWHFRGSVPRCSRIGRQTFGRLTFGRLMCYGMGWNPTEASEHTGGPGAAVETLPAFRSAARADECF